VSAVARPVRSLLLLVDLQRDYLALPGLDPSAGVVVDRARALLAGFRERGLAVIHVWTTVTREEDRRMRHWKRRELWRCEAGSEGHRPAAGLEPRDGEAIVHKTGFDPFVDGELGRLLDELAVERVAIAGIHLHACVREAALGLHERQRIAEIWLAEDAVTSDDPVHAAVTRRYLELRDVRFAPATELLDVVELDLERAHERTGTDGQAQARVRSAARVCRAAAPSWRDAAMGARVEVLLRAAELLDSQVEELARAMAGEIGKPVRYGTVEVSRSAEMLRAIAARCLATRPAEPAAGAELRKRPLGVVAAITPWNNPVYIPLGKIGAALAYGNAVLWKPAPAAQAVAELVAEVFERAGLPEGLVRLVAGARREAWLAMSDAAVDAVTMTGSSLAGFAAQEVCAARRIPLQAELGGNNAALVWLDADLEHAAEEIVEGAFAQAGQRCTANRRVVVESSRHAALLELLCEKTAAMTWGDPHDPVTRIGPMVGAKQRDRLAELLARSGVPAIVPHGRASLEGSRAAWYPPTIVCCDDPASELVQRETFGPVLVVQRATDWSDAISLVNGVDQGLAAALFSGSPLLADRFLEEVDAGIVKLNRSTADAEIDLPFGGWKASAVGPPEHGSFDEAFYTRPQTVYR
jgi:alpha-ketoglutaric semialdehyde dehydrogenase